MTEKYTNLKGTGHLPAAARAQGRADREARRVAADALAVKEEAARNRSGYVPVPTAPPPAEKSYEHRPARLKK